VRISSVYGRDFAQGIKTCSFDERQTSSKGFFFISARILENGNIMLLLHSVIKYIERTGCVTSTRRCSAHGRAGAFVVK